MFPPWLGPAGIALLYAGIVAAGIGLARSWRLAGPKAPLPASLDRNEHAARRSLRMLLAFDFLLVIPACLVLAVAAVASPDGLGPEAIIFGVLAVVLFLAPVPALLRSIRRMEQERLAGRLPQPEPPANTSGLAELDRHLRARAWGTLVAAGLIACGSVAAWVVPDDRLAALLLKDNDAVLAGEVWRLVSVAFVHGSVLHLVFNVSVLVSVGSLLERLAGTRTFLTVLVLGTLAGSILSVALLPQPSVGASGGVLAVAAAVMTFGIRHRSVFPPAARARLFRATVELVALNVVLTFVLPNVDWAGHVGGLLCGAALGWFAKPHETTLAVLAGSAGRLAGAST